MRGLQLISSAPAHVISVLCHIGIPWAPPVLRRNEVPTNNWKPLLKVAHSFSTEHRNMPLTRALALIKERSADIRRDEFSVIAPDFIQTIELMTKRFFLTDAEYLQILQYINSRWNQQKLIEDKQEYDPGNLPAHIVSF